MNYIYSFGSFVGSQLTTSICNMAVLFLIQRCWTWLNAPTTAQQNPVEQSYDPMIDQLIKNLNQQILQSQKMIKDLKALKGKSKSEVEQSEVFQAIMRSVEQQQVPPSQRQRRVTQSELPPTIAASLGYQ